MNKYLLVLLVANVCIIAGYAQSWDTGTGKLYVNPSTTKVGIGTSYPYAALQVNGTSADPFRVQVNGSTKLWVRPNGGVSVGSYYSSPPDNGLYVHGECKVNGKIGVASNSTIFINSLNQGDKRLAIKQGFDNIYMDYLTDLHFRNDYSWESAMVLQNNGNIAIGVDTKYEPWDYCDGYKLSVNGKIRCEELYVTENVPSADYVFDDTYKLMPINELSKYIQANKHLPGIKSADEFKNEGYAVGTMDNALLEKIEELTLYILELEERISQLEGK